MSGFLNFFSEDDRLKEIAAVSGYFWCSEQYCLNCTGYSFSVCVVCLLFYNQKKGRLNWNFANTEMLMKSEN